MKMRLRFSASLVMSIAFMASSAASQPMKPDPIPEIAGPPVGPVVTTHAVAIRGSRIPYRAIFREYALTANGKAQATISATSYVRSDVRDPAGRPVFFFFNGGPGASSSPLHFEAFGPRLRGAKASSPAGFSDNGSSLLDVADLVFIDPVGTGFSRVLPGGDARPYWTPLGDAESVLYLIRAWLRDNHRETSPVFIAGESYGGFRLATMSRDLGDLNVAGLVFISPSLTHCDGCAGSDASFVSAFPSMAMAAWHHGKVAQRGRTPTRFFDEASHFAQTDYLLALEQGSALAPGERQRIARRMSSYIGLSPEQIANADLRISDDVFVDSLLRDRNEVIGRLDTRVAAPVHPPARQGRPKAANDPSLGLGATNVIRSPAITRYMHDALHVPIERDYVALSLDVNFSWRWTDGDGAGDEALSQFPLRSVAKLMRIRPKLRIMVVGGLYDLAVPVLEVRYTIDHSQVPLDRVRFLVLDAGHSSYDTPEARSAFAGAMREFVRAQLGSK
jgi:carboxypeptidase C (cathepsin A)